MKASAVAVLAHNLGIEAELRRASTVLNEAGVAHVVLKGVPQLRRLGLPLDARAVVDNDLLVRRGCLDRALAALEGAGWARFTQGPSPRQVREGFELLLIGQSAVGGQSFIDLHWGLFPPLLYPANEESLWSHVSFEDSEDRLLGVPDAPLTIVHSAAHYAQHGFGEQRILPVLARAWNLWGSEETVDLARQFGLHHALDYGLRVCGAKGLLERPMPSIHSRRAGRLHRFAPLGRPEYLAGQVDYVGAGTSTLLAGPRRALVSAFALTFPPLNVLAAVYGRPPGAMLYGTYLTRPFRPLRRAIRRLGRPWKLRHRSCP